MKIAITSGKGGVGKTLVATCLADVLSDKQPLDYVDCDVEGANGHLFLRPENPERTERQLECIEHIDPDACTHCRRCAEVCIYNALVVGENHAMVFPELCRWCGACLLVCEEQALKTGVRRIGYTYRGSAGPVDLHWGELAAGAGGMSVRLIEHIRQSASNDLRVLDSPPGTGCSVVHTLENSDLVVLVADPTRFGRHDLKLSVQLCRSLGREPVVMINRVGIGDVEALRDWCRIQTLTVVAEIPDSRTIAEATAQGCLPVRESESLRRLFQEAAEKLLHLPLPLRLGRYLREDADQFDLTLNSQPPQPAENADAGAYREISVVSGKGGTGKTSLAACFGQLAETVIADCDVDAADMHLLMEPKVLEGGDFSGGQAMYIEPTLCIPCGTCIAYCKFGAIERDYGKFVTITPEKCEGCGACVLVCPRDAIKSANTEDGRWFWSETRWGRLSHALLYPGRENSGKLVTLVRNTAKAKVSGNGAAATAVLDGSPGTGCPVIASIGGTDMVVIVTEPTVAGIHDLERIIELVRHFKLPGGVIVNKADLHRPKTAAIKTLAEENGMPILGELAYDEVFLRAQQAGRTVLEYEPEGQAAAAIRHIWQEINRILKPSESRI